MKRRALLPPRSRHIRRELDGKCTKVNGAYVAIAGSRFVPRAGHVPRQVPAGTVMKKRPIGRPTDFSERFIKVVYNLRLLGATVDQITEAVGLKRRGNLWVWLQKVPELKRAWEMGGAIADGRVAKSLYHRAIGYSHEATKIFANTKTGEVITVPYTEHYAPDTGAATFWLVNRRRDLWKSLHSIELGGPNGSGLEPPNINIQVISQVEVNGP